MYSRLRAKAIVLGGLSAGLVLQSTCALEPTVTTEQFLLDSTTTLVTDFIFFALNSALIGLI